MTVRELKVVLLSVGPKKLVPPLVVATENRMLGSRVKRNLLLLDTQKKMLADVVFRLRASFWLQAQFSANLLMPAGHVFP